MDIKTPYQLLVIRRLVKLRKENNYTQTMVVELLGVSTGLVGNVESENRSHKYTLGHIYRLCKQFNYPIHKIFLGETIERYSTSQLIDAIIQYEEGI